MSFFAAAVQKVQTVEVIKEVPVVVYQTPPWFNQFVAMADYSAPFVAGYLASVGHSALKRQFPTLQEEAYNWINSAALFGYTLLIAIGYLVLKGQFDTSTLQTIASSLSLAFTGAAGRYAALKAFARPKATPTVAPLADPSFNGATGQF